MALIALGINHTTADVATREQLSFAPEETIAALDAAMHAGVDEIVVVSTCNRSDIFAVLPDSGNKQILLNWWADFHGVSPQLIEQIAYCHYGNEVVSHLARVASGMDSLVLGEPQILGQVKSAFAVAQQANAVGSSLGRLFPFIYSLAKQVRSKTAIGRNPVSVAFAAVSLAKRIFTDLASIHVLLIGAGETIELVIKHLREQGVRELVVANRTLARATTLANNYGAKSALLAEVPDYLPKVDMVISSTASQLPILGKGAVEQAIKQRKHRPMLMIDLAVPRDIEPQVADIADIYLSTIDDLRDIVDSNRRGRALESAQAEEIISDGVAEYERMQRELNAVDTLVEFRRQYHAIREQELAKAMQQLKKGAAPEFVLMTLAHNLTQKMTHAPSVNIKQASAKGEQEALHWFRQLFDISADDGEENDH